MMTAATSFAAPQALTAWYREHRRDLPWRRTRDPYAVWLSETMLQQTRVDTVIPYYHSFLNAYPTIRDLAAADEADVLKRWQGLGYYSRARNLQRAAQTVVREHGGEVPSSPEAFAALPGVGPYTTGAVMSIAFDQPVPAVDGNVLRVMSRYLAIDRPITDPAVKRRITDETAAWLTEVPPSELTQALMELGALVCVPRDPNCAACPLQPGCAAFAAGRTKELPVKKPKVQRRRVTVVALWCDHEGRILLEQRPRDGLLADMWQLPSIEIAEGVAGEPLAAAADRRLQQLFGAAWSEGKACDEAGVEVQAAEDRTDAAREAREVREARRFAEIARLKHIFTHLEWDVRVFRPVSWEPPQSAEAPAGCVWADEAAFAKLALPRVYDKLLSRHFDSPTRN